MMIENQNSSEKSDRAYQPADEKGDRAITVPNYLKGFTISRRRIDCPTSDITVGIKKVGCVARGVRSYGSVHERK